MWRSFAGFALASVVASASLGGALWLQQTVAGPSAGMDDLRGPGPLIGYLAFASVMTFLPVALIGALTDIALHRLRRPDLWAYASAGLIAGALIGWALAALTPQSDEDDGSIARVWQLALFGLTAASTYWWAVRRKP